MSSAPKFVPQYTVENYRHWEGDWQLIEGVPVAMSPSPFGPQERAVSEFSFILKSQLKEQGSDCLTYTGLDWIVSDETVVRPDVMVVCGEQPEKHLRTAPVIVVEVLSKSTQELDLVFKRNIYRNHGVLFYLIADTEKKTIEIIRNQVDSATSETFTGDQTGVLQLPNGAEIKVAVQQIFN